MPLPDPKLITLLEPPITIEYAKILGFKDFSFHSTQRDAQDYATRHSLATGLKTIAFDQEVPVGNEIYVLHVVGTAERRRPPAPKIVKAEEPDAFGQWMDEWREKICKK